MILNPNMNQWSDNLTRKSLQEVQLYEFSTNQMVKIIIFTGMLHCWVEVEDIKKLPNQINFLIYKW
jgi:hypothetical protein